VRVEDFNVSLIAHKPYYGLPVGDVSVNVFDSLNIRLFSSFKPVYIVAEFLLRNVVFEGILVLFLCLLEYLAGIFLCDGFFEAVV